MQLHVSVHSVANDTEYGGDQTIQAEIGEYLLDEIFRLPTFRIIIDDVIEDAVCFRLMEGAVAHYYVLDSRDRRAEFHRDTSLGEDNFVFEYRD